MTTLPYRAKAAFDYTAEQENELSLKKDDDLIIEEVNDSGWCLAKRGTDAGWVPQDYIEKVVETSGSPLTSKEEQEIQKTIQQLAQANADVSSTVQQPKEGKAPNLDAKTCQRCRKPIESAFVVAKDYTFHAECFKCVTCNQELGGKAFIEKDGQFFCEDDYYTSFNPKCGHCGEIIKGQYISALNKAWHPDHFVCTVCKKPFDGSQFRKHDDKPYCDEHFAQLFATPCTKCGQNITGQVFEALGKKYHLDCFTCEVGSHKIGENVNFHAHEGKIYCPAHFEEIVLNRCSGCNQLIRGQYIKISDKYYHPECWKCKECNTVLTASTCLQVQNVWYCKTCAAKVKARTPASSAPVVDGEAERKAKEALLKIQAEKEARERAEKDKLRAAEEQKKKKDEDLAKLKAGQKSDSLVGPGYSLFEVEYNLLVSEKCPSTVDPAKKELYLSDAEFMSKFKVDKAEFAKMPAWKQKNAKTTLRLF